MDEEFNENSIEFSSTENEELLNYWYNTRPERQESTNIPQTIILTDEYNITVYNVNKDDEIFNDGIDTKNEPINIIIPQTQFATLKDLISYCEKNVPEINCQPEENELDLPNNTGFSNFGNFEVTIKTEPNINTDEENLEFENTQLQNENTEKLSTSSSLSSLNPQVNEDLNSKISEPVSLITNTVSNYNRNEEMTKRSRRRKQDFSLIYQDEDFTSAKFGNDDLHSKYSNIDVQTKKSAKKKSNIKPKLQKNQFQNMNWKKPLISPYLLNPMYRLLCVPKPAHQIKKDYNPHIYVISSSSRNACKSNLNRNSIQKKNIRKTQSKNKSSSTAKQPLLAHQLFKDYNPYVYQYHSQIPYRTPCYWTFDLSYFQSFHTKRKSSTKLQNNNTNQVDSYILKKSSKKKRIKINSLRKRSQNHKNQNKNIKQNKSQVLPNHNGNLTSSYDF